MGRTSLHFLPDEGEPEEPLGPWGRKGWTREGFARARHVSGAVLRLASFSPRYLWVVELQGRSARLVKARGAPPFKWAEKYISTWWIEPPKIDVPKKGLKKKERKMKVGRSLWELWDLLKD